jgi:hypothetical protein
MLIQQNLLPFEDVLADWTKRQTRSVVLHIQLQFVHHLLVSDANLVDFLYDFAFCPEETFLQSPVALFIELYQISQTLMRVILFLQQTVHQFFMSFLHGVHFSVD